MDPILDFLMNRKTSPELFEKITKITRHISNKFKKLDPDDFNQDAWVYLLELKTEDEILNAGAFIYKCLLNLAYFLTANRIFAVRQAPCLIILPSIAIRAILSSEMNS